MYVLGVYELSEHERVILHQACQTLDLCTDLQTILEASGAIVTEAGRSKAKPRGGRAPPTQDRLGEVDRRVENPHGGRR
jgi:hypothetical protein